MGKFVKSAGGEFWVVEAPGRIGRLEEQKVEAHVAGKCVFCPGNEELNKAVFQIGEGAAWQVRVIANKYPITEHHEVIIHSPDHEADFDTLPQRQTRLILETFRQRLGHYRRKGFERVLIINNHGLHAGATIAHPHSQLLAFPANADVRILPKQPPANVVWEGKHFNLYCPRYSEWPYEVWIAPRTARHKGFGEAGDEELAELSDLLPKILRVVLKKFAAVSQLHKHKDDLVVPYNFYISWEDDWYLRIIPRLVHPGGVELSGAAHVNLIPPEQAAEEYGKEWER